MTGASKVTALIITYAPDKEVLRACIDSLRAQNPQPEIVIFDNFAETDPSHSIANFFKRQDCVVLTSQRNLGFAGAINEALRSIKTGFVLISNYDIVYDSNFIGSALTALVNSSDDVVGVTGKTLFYPPNAKSNWPGLGPGNERPSDWRGTGGVIDNTGTLVNGYMLAYNRGVGQIDIGQFDQPDRPMGACFAAFLARRKAFSDIKKGGVGPLDTSYFMYYEDIDWCYRANILGFKILYEPAAIAWHHHSLTTRDKPLTFKYHLIQRNLYRTIMKNMRFRTVIRLWAFHARMHIRRARIEKKFGTVTAKILLETLLWAVVGLFKRAPIQSARKISDTDIVNLSIGEEGHLDDVSLEPQPDWRNPLASLTRLRHHYPDDPAIGLIPLVEKLANGTSDSDTVAKAIELARDKCPALVPLMSMIENGSG